jgi:hypothetical protein
MTGPMPPVTILDNFWQSEGNGSLRPRIQEATRA